MCFAETDYEKAILELMRDELGYNYVYGPEMERDHTNPILVDVLQNSLHRINPTLPHDAIDDAIKKLRQIEGS